MGPAQSGEGQGDCRGESDALSEAARHRDGSRRSGSEAAEDLQQAIAWIEEMPVLHDHIVLLRKKLDSLAPEHPKLEHPLRPVLAGHIRRWMDGLPAADRAYYP
ncbi:hypothetical protein [Candidatus Thiosymbion oneisti]|uniref:hypothetical protein n=1 Tax=Candidatus Thiosymbion oneisti TaxID=589554 RepID=UPI00105E2B4B|nr:hypothetical protein [Candidatus Thiosymbion oneisti]